MSKPVSKNYLQINYSDFGRVIGEERFQKVRDIIYNHHCQFATKEGMFVVERFFCNDIDENDNIVPSFIYQAVMDYLRHYNIPISAEAQEYEDCAVLAEGYDGILFDWTW